MKWVIIRESIYCDEAPQYFVIDAENPGDALEEAIDKHIEQRGGLSILFYKFAASRLRNIDNVRGY